MIHETVPGYFNYRDFYEQHLPLEGPARIVEIGLLFGKSACFMLETLRRRGVDAEVFFIDNYAFDTTGEYLQSSLSEYGIPDVSSKTCRNMAINALNQVGVPFTFIERSSSEARELFDEASIDMLFIDGAHDYASVLDDVSGWYSRVRGGGIVAGDDYDSEHFPGLVRAVDEFFGEDVDAQGSTWYHRK